MKLKDWLAKATHELEQAGIGTARLDALVLLEDVTGIDRARLLAAPDQEISPDDVTRLKKLLRWRAAHVPLAYVRGKTEFYGREFAITPAVLEPRPESETMIDMFLELDNLPTQPKVADVGCGSGALGITALLERPKIRLEMLEIDPKAAEVAKMNVDKFTLDIPVIICDLLEGSQQSNDVLLCNLPYVPDGYQINLAALHEPRRAIFGGPDGLDVYRRLFAQVNKGPQKPLYILCECLPFQQIALTETATKNNYQEIRRNDFIQLFGRIQKSA